MKTLIIYHSRQGFTKQYAEWIQEELDCDIMEYKKTRIRALERYDNIIFGSGIYASNIEGLDAITKCYERRKMKNIIIFVVGISDPKDKKTKVGIGERVEEKIGPFLARRSKIFYFQGGLKYDNLSRIYKHMLKGMARTMSKNDPKKLKAEDKIIINAQNEEADFTSKNKVAQLVKYVKELEEKEDE